MHSHSFKTCMILLFFMDCYIKAFILLSNNFLVFSIPPYPIISQHFSEIFLCTPVPYIMIQNKKQRDNRCLLKVFISLIYS